MNYFFIKAVIVLLFSLVAAITDFKTGYIYSWITYPFIFLGFIFAFLTNTFVQSLAMFLIVFLFGLVLYYRGGIGGGDVYLLSGITLYFPFYNGFPFILSVLLFASLLAMLFYGTYYFIYLLNKKPNNFTITFIFILIISFFVVFLIKTTLLYSFAIFYFLVVSLVSLFFKQEIMKKYKKEIFVKELLDDDLADLSFMDKGEMVPLDEKLYKEVKEKLKPEDKIVVYRNLPIFGPFIFLGILFSFYFLKFL